MSSNFIGKTRNAGAVIFFGLITLGIYNLVWYYKINNEIKQRDKNQSVSPGLAVFALFIPIVNIVSLYNTTNRIKLMQKADGSTDLISPSVSLIWVLLFGIGYPIYLQGALNNHWHELTVRSRKESDTVRNVNEATSQSPLVAEIVSATP